MFNRLRKLCGRYMRALLPRKLYKLIANGAIIVPAYYKDIIADAETNFDLSLEEQGYSIDAKICTYYR